MCFEGEQSWMTFRLDSRLHSTFFSTKIISFCKLRRERDEKKFSLSFFLNYIIFPLLFLCCLRWHNNVLCKCRTFFCLFVSKTTKWQRALYTKCVGEIKFGYYIFFLLTLSSNLCFLYFKSVMSLPNMRVREKSRKKAQFSAFVFSWEGGKKNNILEYISLKYKFFSPPSLFTTQVLIIMRNRNAD